ERSPGVPALQTKSEEEGSAGSGSVRLRPDLPAMRFDDAPGQGQPHTSPFGFRIELLEDVEDPLAVGRVKPLAVVPHVKRPVRAGPQADRDRRLSPYDHELRGVFEEVLENFDQPLSIDHDFRK